jgi:hypothetical protein
VTDRKLLELKYTVGKRVVTFRAMDQIGPEDTYDVLFRATLHRFGTLGKEDLMTPIPREVKDYMIKTNLFI